MNRRDFALCLAAAGPMAALPSVTWAQGEPQEGREYARIQPAVPVPANGKVEVIEFFGYWCPHCNEFEPTLEAWVRKLPPDIAFRRVPVAFNGSQATLQKLYYALEALGLVDTMQRKAFAAIHVQRMRFDKDADLAAFAKANGIDPAKLLDTATSFSIDTKVKAANQMLRSYQIDAVPMLTVGGRYRTSVGQAGGSVEALQVTEALVRKVKRG